MAGGHPGAVSTVCRFDCFVCFVYCAHPDAMLYCSQEGGAYMGTDGSQGSGAITADPGEQSALHRVEGLFAETSAPKLVGQDGEQIPLPDSVLRVLRQTVHHLAQGASVTVMPVEAD